MKPSRGCCDLFNKAIVAIEERNRQSPIYLEALAEVKARVLAIGRSLPAEPAARVAALRSLGGWNKVISATIAEVAGDKTLPGSKMFGDTKLASLLTQESNKIREETQLQIQ